MNGLLFGVECLVHPTGLVLWNDKQENIYNNVIYSDYEISIEALKDILKTYYPQGTITSVCGFSRGGVNAYEQIGKVKFVCLIDPSIPKDYTTEKLQGNVFMVYNPKVWDGNNRERLYNVADELGTDAQLLTIPHTKIPSYFFKFTFWWIKNLVKEKEG